MSLYNNIGCESGETHRIQIEMDSVSRSETSRSGVLRPHHKDRWMAAGPQQSRMVLAGSEHIPSVMF